MADTAIHTPEGTYEEAFDRYVRKGDKSAVEAWNRQSLPDNADGGCLVPKEVDEKISARLAELSPMRQVADVRPTEPGTRKKEITVPVPEAAITATLEYPTMELYAMPAATQALLDDPAVSVGDFIASETGVPFSLQESDKFITGNGLNQPRGLLDYPQVANERWTWGTLGITEAEKITHDSLVDFIYSLRAGYRANGAFLLNRTTAGIVRTIKDEDGEYVWQPALSDGQPPTLYNMPAIECEDMPDAGPGKVPIAFGDFRRGYLVVDCLGTRVLRDPYTRKPYVLFYTTKRVGGGVQNFEAIKLFKCSEWSNG